MTRIKILLYFFFFLVVLSPDHQLTNFFYSRWISKRTYKATTTVFTVKILPRIKKYSHCFIRLKSIKKKKKTVKTYKATSQPQLLPIKTSECLGFYNYQYLGHSWVFYESKILKGKNEREMKTSRQHNSA